MNERFAFDLDLAGRGTVAGADEAGRGCLAGPLVAAAVCFDYAVLDDADFAALDRLDDSKKVPKARRAALYDEVLRRARQVVIVCCSRGHHRPRRPPPLQPRDRWREPWKASRRQPGVTLVDGFALPGCRRAHRAVVGGDGRSAAIAAASVVAKVTRDRLMRRLHLSHPQYGFDRHVGYATAAHREAIVGARRLRAAPAVVRQRRLPAARADERRRRACGAAPDGEAATHGIVNPPASIRRTSPRGAYRHPVTRRRAALRCARERPATVRPRGRRGRGPLSHPVRLAPAGAQRPHRPRRARHRRAPRPRARLRRGQGAPHAHVRRARRRRRRRASGVRSRVSPSSGWRRVPGRCTASTRCASTSSPSIPRAFPSTMRHLPAAFTLGRAGSDRARRSRVGRLARQHRQ